MVTLFLNLAAPPEPTDASDALAIAICHIHTAHHQYTLPGGRKMKYSTRILISLVVPAAFLLFPSALRGQNAGQSVDKDTVRAFHHF